MDAGLFFGALIIALGHVTNITLGIMGGVIHGLRLNFLEWYHHCFEGGGKKFNPLKLFS
jgi:V/A-type H+-transporting ATPase subunit I